MPGTVSSAVSLPGVTLVCADCAQPQAALLALAACMSGCRFERVLFFTDAAVEAPPGIEVVAIPRLANRVDYSRFMIKELAPHVTTEHALVVQWDGYVAHPRAWREMFRQYDYIGAVWYWHDDGHRVGNGGFSLRSHRLLLALQDERIAANTMPEDITICREHRELLERDHGIAFAPEPLARLFAYEREESPLETFGFHGVFNVHRHADDRQFAALIGALPAEVLAGADGLRMLAAAVSDGRAVPARAWAERMVRAYGQSGAAALLVPLLPAHVAAGPFLELLLEE